MTEKFKEKLNQVFTKEGIESMKYHLEKYKNDTNNGFNLAPFYYMTIIRKVIGLSNN